jgi:hypothetical protein
MYAYCNIFEFARISTLTFAKGAGDVRIIWRLNVLSMVGVSGAGMAGDDVITEDSSTWSRDWLGISHSGITHAARSESRNEYRSSCSCYCIMIFIKTGMFRHVLV